MKVEVSDENGFADPLVIGGYRISGKAISDGQPTPGVTLVLHTTNKHEIDPGKLQTDLILNRFTAYIIFMKISP